MLVKGCIRLETVCCLLFHPCQSADETGNMLEVAARVRLGNSHGAAKANSRSERGPSSPSQGKQAWPLHKAAGEEVKSAELL
jgi:hypothetical protein